MYIYTNRLSQVSDLTSPGISSLDITSNPSLSSPHLGMSQSNLSYNNNQKDQKECTPTDLDSSTDLEDKKVPSQKHSNKNYKDALRFDAEYQDEDEDEDEDDDSYQPEKLTEKKTAAETKIDEFLHNNSDSEDDTSDDDNILELQAPNLSTAEKQRSQLKSSTTRGERKRKVASVSSSTKSYSMSFSKRMKELKKAKIQNAADDFPFIKGTMAQDARGVMKCVPCGKEVDYLKLSTIQNHVKSQRHINHVSSYNNQTIPMMNSMRDFLSDKERKNQEKGIGTKTSIDTQTLRMKLCQALLTDGLPFKFLESSNPNGLGFYIRSFANVNISYRKITDMIPEVLSLEMSTVSSDLDKANAMSVIFDATPNRGEAFAVVIRYVDDQFELHHRCVSLVFYES